ncbi:MAG: hypothetical protein DHS20C15_30110 [Planctomycetota bacterium]|nr:MAG: hypothetical protein DHS20C15_30110 [Planctomycetota bacterium]
MDPAEDDVFDPMLGSGAAERPAGGLPKRLRLVGEALLTSLQSVLAALPDAPLRPSGLVRALSVNRAVASKVLQATSQTDPLAALHQLPGPEPLRKLLRAAARRGAPADAVAAAQQAVADFDTLIRRDAGTRPALDAMLAASLPGARERFELASKYSVFKGLSQLKGAQADAWIGAAVLEPSASEPDRIDLTWLNSAVAMRRLRPGVGVRFSYRHRGPAAAGAAPASESAQGVVSLEQFCVNPPAQLEARHVGDTIHYTLPDDLLGPRRAADMFVVDHHPHAMQRYTDPAAPRRSSLFVDPPIPVATLVFDVLLHPEAFPGAEPELLIYDTGYDGIANVNDRDRDLDRMDVSEHVEYLGRDASALQLSELPRYGDALAHLATRFGWDLSTYRAYRTRIQYPVHGWQVSMAFQPPSRGVH